MKRNVPVLLIAALFTTLLLTGCSKKQDISFDLDKLPAQVELTTVPVIKTGKVDVDLTKMSTTMVYAEVFNMLIEPENYEGKMIKAKGNFNIFTNENNGETYYAILIKDATQCCQEGIEFVWPDHKFPDDYPQEDQEITITGRYTVKVLDGGITYTYLTVSSLELN